MTRRITKKDYTVVGFYSDNDQPWVEWVRAATSPQDAVQRAMQVSARRQDLDAEAELEVRVVDVFLGCQRGLLENPSVETHVMRRRNSRSDALKPEPAGRARDL